MHDQSTHSAQEFSELSLIKLICNSTDHFCVQS